MRLLSLSEVARIFQCEGVYSSVFISDFCIDSRLLKPQALFFALKGDRVDGHTYLDEVRQKEALAAVVSKNYRGSCSGLTLLYVDDPLQSLQELAKFILSTSIQRVVGITGSLGKTTTKEFVKTLLSKKFKVAASPGNSNSQVGLPLSILNHSSASDEILILEMGMTAPHQISKLVQIAPPEVALISTVSLVHACNFESIEEIGHAKGEIFSHPKTQLGILNREISCFKEIEKLSKFPVVSFSAAGLDSDYRFDSFNANILFCRLDSSISQFGNLPIPGKHNASNFLAAVAVARYFKLSWDEIQSAIQSLTLPNFRLQFITHKGILFLNDSYNAAEASIKAALETLKLTQCQGRKIAVLGSMLELGKFSSDCHERVGEFALDIVDEMYCLGKECLPIYEIWKKAGRRVQFFLSRKELLTVLKTALKPLDHVLLKGSRSWELWKILEEI